jgi:hypothetical protein
MNCLNCQKELPQIQGKKARQYCNETCRSSYWHRQKRKQKKEAEKELAMENDIQAILDTCGSDLTEMRKDLNFPGVAVIKETPSGITRIDPKNIVLLTEEQKKDRITVIEGRLKYPPSILPSASRKALEKELHQLKNQ